MDKRKTKMSRGKGMSSCRHKLEDMIQVSE